VSMLPLTLLGIFILFWPDVLYTYYLGVPRIGGISTGLDQQLGALVMLSSAMAVLFIMGLPLQYYKSRPLSWP
jgi:cytochrome c oxidase assembly factor CtaG